MFVGRNREIEQLNAFYEGDRCGVAALYGSVGMGKTTLLREFAKGKRHIFYTAYETTDSCQLELLARAMGLPAAISIEELLDKITEMAKDEKLLLVIDHYPDFVKADASFEKTLYRYVTEIWKELPVKLILCSDAYLAMEKQVYGKKGLYRDKLELTMELKPLGFYDSCAFFPDASAEERMFLYGITGGVPAQLECLPQEPKEAVFSLFFSPQGRPEGWLNRIMAKELREMAYYNRMLTTMALGYDRVNAISAQIDKPKDIVVPYLNTLMNIGMVSKENAITEPTNRKKTRYGISNLSVLFWYRYIAPHMDLYFQKDYETLWKEYIAADLDDYMKRVFVEVCREYLGVRSDGGQMPFAVEKTGNWWRNDDDTGESEGFDLVSLGTSEGRTATIFCLCYYHHSPIEVAELKGLIEMSRQLHREGDVYYLVFSKSGFHENALTVSATIRNIMLLTAEDVCLLQ